MSAQHTMKPASTQQKSLTLGDTLNSNGGLESEFKKQLKVSPRVKLLSSAAEGTSFAIPETKCA